MNAGVGAGDGSAPGAKGEELASSPGMNGMTGDRRVYTVAALIEMRKNVQHIVPESMQQKTGWKKLVDMENVRRRYDNKMRPDGWRHEKEFDGLSRRLPPSSAPTRGELEQHTHRPTTSQPSGRPQGGKTLVPIDESWLKPLPNADGVLDELLEGDLEDSLEPEGPMPPRPIPRSSPVPVRSARLVPPPPGFEGVVKSPPQRSPSPKHERITRGPAGPTGPVGFARRIAAREARAAAEAAQLRERRNEREPPPADLDPPRPSPPTKPVFNAIDQAFALDADDYSFEGLGSHDRPTLEASLENFSLGRDHEATERLPEPTQLPAPSQAAALHSTESSNEVAARGNAENQAQAPLSPNGDDELSPNVLSFFKSVTAQAVVGGPFNRGPSEPNQTAVPQSREPRGREQYTEEQTQPAATPQAPANNSKHPIAQLPHPGSIHQYLHHRPPYSPAHHGMPGPNQVVVPDPSSGEMKLSGPPPPGFPSGPPPGYGAYPVPRPFLGPGGVGLNPPHPGPQPGLPQSSPPPQTANVRPGSSAGYTADEFFQFFQGQGGGAEGPRRDSPLSMPGVVPNQHRMPPHGPFHAHPQQRPYPPIPGPDMRFPTDGVPPGVPTMQRHGLHQAHPYQQPGMPIPGRNQSVPPEFGAAFTSAPQPTPALDTQMFGRPNPGAQSRVVTAGPNDNPSPPSR